MTPLKEWARAWRNPQVDIGLLHAFYVEHAFPRHTHDYYVISLVERGLQSFIHEGERYHTPPGGVILINPGAVHTGEAAGDQGYEMRCLYPTLAQMQRAFLELTDRHEALPFFTEIRVDDPAVATAVASLHRALARETSPLEAESRLTWTLVQLIKHFAGARAREKRPGQERRAIRQARAYIEEQYARGITLAELAAHVSLSPYYLLRLFRDAMGMPPYAYQESVRIRRAQQLIREGTPLAEVALAVGYSSQSHLTHRFKRVIGVTPGHYARQLQ